MSQICPLCQVNSGRISPLECCQIRHFANAPRHIQRAEYAGIAAAEGKATAEEWGVKVKAEIERLKGLK